MGGAAELTFNNNEGQQMGAVKANFNLDDQGVVCPVITDVDVCTSSWFSWGLKDISYFHVVWRIMGGRMFWWPSRFRNVTNI